MMSISLETPSSRAAVLKNAATLVPLAAAESAAVEENRGISASLAAAMRAAGVFQMAFPKHRDGLEMGIADQVDVVALLAAADASVGWHVGVLNATGYYAGRLGDDAYAELYPHFDLPTAGSFHPRGRAVEADGGYLVTGEWDWGSGAAIADHIIGGCLVESADGTPVLDAAGRQVHLGLWLPRGAVVSADNWQTLGLRGSGSASFRIDSPAFVPAGHSFDREAGFDPAANPLNRTPLIAHYALGGVVLGIARHLCSIVGEALRARSTRSDSQLQVLGEVMLDVDLAYAGVRGIAQRIDDILFAGEGVLTPAHEARMTAMNAASGAMLRRILPQCLELAGSHYVFDSHPIQPVIRDALSSLAHSGTRRSHFAGLAAAALDDVGFGFSVADDPSDWRRRIERA